MTGGEIVGIEDSSSTISCRVNQYDDMFVWGACQTVIEDMAKEKGFTVKLYEDSAVGMNDLKLGRIDAYANTTTNVNAFTHNNTDAKFRFFDEQLLANNVAYFLQKTDDGDKLTKELDDVIQDMLDDGTVAKITEKWMYADMTKLIQK